MNRRFLLALLIGWLIAFVLPPRDVLAKLRGA